MIEVIAFLVGAGLNAAFLAGKTVHAAAPALAPPPPAGRITRVDPPDGSTIDPGSSLECGIGFHNDAAVAHSFSARFVGRGVRTGTVHFDVTTPKTSISPCTEITFGSGVQTMPEEDLEVAITVHGGS